MRKYHSDYDLTKKEDMKKYLKAINERIKQTYKTFGKDSKLYKDTERAVKEMFFFNKNIYTESKDGVFQLKTGKDFLEEKNFSIIEKKKYLDKPTTNEFLKQTLDKMKERGEIENDIKLNQKLQGPPSIDENGKLHFPSVKEQIIKYSIEVAQLSADIREDYAYLYGYEDDEEIKEAINTLKISGRRNTYDELEQISNAVNKAKRKYLGD